MTTNQMQSSFVCSIAGFAGHKRLTHIATVCAVLAIIAGGATANAQNTTTFKDPTGVLATFDAAGKLDTGNPFFQSLGSNGRSCGSCHQASDGWSVTPPHIQARFDATEGLDPIFRPVDGATCPTADVSSEQSRKHAYSLLLKKGLIRVSLPVPAGAEFVVLSAQDPNQCAETTIQQLALFRRPLPSTNLGFLSTVMWDGRETVRGQAIDLDLMTQAKDATLGHAQASNTPSDMQLAQIVAFETALFTAQQQDNDAGNLDARGAHGGPRALSQQPFYLGINDAFGQDPTGAAFDPNAFNLYQQWADLAGDGNSASTENDDSGRNDARASVARGEALFNTFPIPITGVAGINDSLNQTVVMGTCTTCHDTPNAGDHSLSVPLNIGIASYPATAPLDISGLPVYTVLCNSTGQLFQVTDVGRAMITGKCADIGKTKGPVLRGLAARAPYFHNGSAATLMDAVNFYTNRFNLNLTDQQKQDLVAFLQSL